MVVLSLLPEAARSRLGVGHPLWIRTSEAA